MLRWSQEDASLEALLAYLRDGKLLILPTETVYGIAAPIANAKAIETLYAIKGRPSSKALPVLVPDASSARALTRHWPEQAQALAERYWPGPLTMVLPAAAQLPRQVTAGKDSVGLRVPAQAFTLSLLRAWGAGLATPSANPSDLAPASTVEQCQRYWPQEEAIAVAVDAGPTLLQVPSTVLEWVEGRWHLRREGVITRAELSALLASDLSS
ncbi:MAG: L-threonylcarbamoyladenylate synthase [Myxococcota bacterium]|jgi:L-threonylcarbamoyladenylate synthase|nr:L-threonylcarbamoyladenylate synthase [Myxococcota bacterium]